MTEEYWRTHLCLIHDPDRGWRGDVIDRGGPSTNEIEDET